MAHDPVTVAEATSDFPLLYRWKFERLMGTVCHWRNRPQLIFTQEGSDSAHGWKGFGRGIGVAIEDLSAELTLLTTEQKLEAANRKGLDHDKQP